MTRELRTPAEVRSACGDDDLVMWAAQGLRPGARAWAAGGAVVAGCPVISRWDRLAVWGRSRDAVPLVRHALAELGPSYRPLGDVELSGGHLPTLDADGAAAWPQEGLLLDARAGERFRGEVEPVDPRAGHIPGAVSAPTAENLGDGGTFLPTDALTQRFAALGAPAGGRVAVYCGSGVTAAHQAAALTMAGYEPVLYPGSWSQWSSDPDRPVATGD